MSALQLTVKHGRTLEEARKQLEHAVDEVRGRFALLIHRVEWADDRNSVILSGTGFFVEMRVDAQDVYVTGDIPLLGQLLGGPLASGVKKIVRQTFQKRLT
jgi:Putative polyhydroxyalkanoic acid system protein (PHA_gran_rgn)